MTVAEIHGKISDSGTNLSERMEDLLTADVFGCLRYIPAEKGLLPFLRTATSLNGEALDIRGKIAAVHSAFWPWLTSPGCTPCEPDVVLGLETEDQFVHLIGVEAKYFSGISSEEDESVVPNNQLARELDNLDGVSPTVFRWDAGLRVASRRLMFVTQDMSMPRADLARSLAEFRRKRESDSDIFWTSWRFLPPILEASIAVESNPGQRAVLVDMLRLLLRKELTMFGGVDACAVRFDSADFQFYQQSSRSYEWSGITEVGSLSIGYIYEVVKHD